ncbi:TPA: hypothetical protein QCP59_004193 [Bacillus cereus]|nr:hypothetical protein [Bacillus cereus]
MSTSAYDELQLFAQEIQSFLSLNILQDLARDVGFVQWSHKSTDILYSVLDFHLRLAASFLSLLAFLIVLPALQVT